MREPALKKIYTAESSAEAETIIGWLRTKGLHPAELGLTTPLAPDHTDSKFPIKVPIEEGEMAASAIENRPRLASV